MQILRPELIIDKRPLKNIAADLVICDAITFYAGRYISKINKSIPIKNEIFSICNGRFNCFIKFYV